MLKENLVYSSGVVDVSIVVPVCFENPLRRYAVEFLSYTLMSEKQILVPITAILGAYHIATRYLKVSRKAVKTILTGILETHSPSLYPRIDIDTAVNALDVATIYNIESWDGYLVALAISLGLKTIYTLDKELKKIKEINVVNPFPKETVREYHKYIVEILKK